MKCLNPLAPPTVFHNHYRTREFK